VDASSAPPAAAELIARISWLIRLRWIAIVGVVIILLFARLAFRASLALGPLLAVMATLALYNAMLARVFGRLRSGPKSASASGGAWQWLETRIVLLPIYPLKAGLAVLNAAKVLALGLPSGGDDARRRAQTSSLARLLVPRAWWHLGAGWELYRAAAFASAQISVDLLAVAFLYHFSGGVENPFAFFVIFHVIVCSMLLSRRATLLHATTGFGLLVVVALGELLGVLPHLPVPELGWQGSYDNPGFVVTHLVALGTTVYFAAYLGSSIGARLRFRERDIVLLSDEIREKIGLLESAYEKLAETERAKSRYMRKVSHELRGPLGTIQTALKVVVDGLAGDLSERSRDLLARAERRAGELALVTEDLLTLSRAREANLQDQLEDVAPDRVVNELVAEASRQAQRAGVTITVDSGADIGTIRAEARAFQEMIGNLLGNAVRYTPAGGSVTVRLRRPDATLRIEVQDTGIGIADEDLPHIFDEFYRAGNARAHAHEGTGLGLAIVKAVVERHGGTVTVDSAPGRGSLFVVELPLVPPRAPGRPSVDLA
jgi:signal transduction histidine kinase